tara:strand:+ start:781 stop:1128 length:348 start_codon:yes stop_codon:yes gene_type:complete
MGLKKQLTQTHFEAYDYFKTNFYYHKNDTIYCIIKHVSKSGMTRHISFFYIRDNEPRFITSRISDFLEYKMNKYHDAIVVGGCGMDMAFSVVNHLQQQLQHYHYRKDFKLNHRII